MVTSEPAEVTASETRPSGFRIRWGWFLGCVASGLVAIVVGWFVTAPADRMNYLAQVLAGVGTTLLLVGIVVLLERRIVDNAVRKFRNATEEARARMRDDFRIQVQDFTDRVSAEWAAASPEDVDAMKERTKRLSNELADNYVDETLETYEVDDTPERCGVRELGQVLAEPLGRDWVGPLRDLSSHSPLAAIVIADVAGVNDACGAPIPPPVPSRTSTVSTIMVT